MVDLHSFVPTSSTAQKLANWGHLNRKVLSKLNLRIPDELIRQLVQSQLGAAEKVLLQLRDRIEERQRHSKGGGGQVSSTWGWGDIRYLDTGRAGCPTPHHGVCVPALGHSKSPP
ncbi:SPEF1 protein, partial [Grallaria varia]|nr:SPEF1 protein [Grallaria varia]